MTIHKIAWRAHWTPAALSPIDVALSLYAMSAMAIVRGMDYGIGEDGHERKPPAGPPPGPAYLSQVEAAAPLWAWSAAFIIGGALLLTGALKHWHGCVWLGHWLLGVLYTALAVGIAIPVISAPWLDGIRSATVLILPATMHWILALRTGPRPVQSGHATATLIAQDDTPGG